MKKNLLAPLFIFYLSLGCTNSISESKGEQAFDSSLQSEKVQSDLKEQSPENSSQEKLKEKIIEVNNSSSNFSREQAKILIEENLKEYYKNKPNECLFNMFCSRANNGDWATYVWDGHGSGKKKSIEPLIKRGYLDVQGDGNAHKIVFLDLADFDLLRKTNQDYTVKTNFWQVKNVTITGIRKTEISNQTIVEYNYELEPIEETAFIVLAQVDHQNLSGEKSFIKYDDGWRIKQ